MSGYEHVRRFDEVMARDVERAVTRALSKKGVPVSHTQAYELVKELYPQVLRAREASWRAHMVELGRQAVLAGVELYPEPAPEYPAKALFDAVAQVCRLTPDPTFLHVEMLDEETGRLVKQPVLPSADNRVDARVVRRVSGELGRRVGRHVLAAGREAVARSVENGSARYMGSRRPARVGYARVLTGKESCAFCAMLASRGAVYSSDTVVRRKDGRKYHDGCDCIPVLVVKGKPWEGQAEAEALYEAWLASAWGRTDAEQRAAWARAVRSGEIDTRKYSPLVGERGSAPPPLAGVSRKGSKRTMKTAVSRANPTGDRKNCVRCVNAWAMRRLGYDVAAAPGQPGMGAEESTKTWRNARGETPTWVKVELEGRAPQWRDLQDEFLGQPAGSFGFISYRSPNQFSHVAAWQLDGNNVTWVDPQNPGNDVGLALPQAVAGSVKWVRLNGYRPTMETAEIVERTTDED